MQYSNSLLGVYIDWYCHALSLHTAPEASPMNIVVEAVDTQSVKISWSPPPTHLQNGIIRNHLILYHPVASPDRVSEVASGVSEALLSMPPGPGVSYNFTVAAVTVARGPFSEGVIQQTYPLAPAFPRDPPRTVSGFNATRTTISIQLPSVNITQFRYTSYSCLFLTCVICISICVYCL